MHTRFWWEAFYKTDIWKSKKEMGMKSDQMSVFQFLKMDSVPGNYLSDYSIFFFF
jgi:hypothetical protein